MKRSIGWMMLGLAATVMGCARPSTAEMSGARLPPPVRDLPPATNAEATAVAVFAGGCFWCAEAVFEQLDGVITVVSGYAGGTAATARYSTVSAGGTGHAEAVQVTYQPARISYGKLLQVFFSTTEPTQAGGQGLDHGPQYRSAIFYADEAQRAVAAAYIAQLNQAKAFAQPIVTTLEPLERFYPAEEYHQDYTTRNPTDGYVRRWSLPKRERVCQMYPELVKEKKK